MMEFDSPGAFAEHLMRVAARLPAAEAMAMDQGAKVIQDAAKESLGYDQGAAGPFGAWPPLAARTREERAEQGYPEDEPLKRSGLLGDNIERCAEAREARVGVPDLEVSHPYDNRTENIGEIAEDQEFGTRDIPPRSFIGRAAFVHGEGAAGVVLSVVAAAVSGLTPAKK
jgi:hypothetical protein